MIYIVSATLDYTFSKISPEYKVVKLGYDIITGRYVYCLLKYYLLNNYLDI